MRKGLTALLVFVSLCGAVTPALMLAADKVEEFDIEIALPKSANNNSAGNIKPVMTQASSKQKTPEEFLWGLREANTSGIDFGVAFAQGIMASILDAQEQKQQSLATKTLDNQEGFFPSIPKDSACLIPQVPEKVLVGNPIVARFSLIENAHSYKIVAGDTIPKVLAEIQKMTGGRVDTDRILAAIFRENPMAFTTNGLVAGKVINVPTDRRILLEEAKTGQAVLNAANNSKLKTLKLPDLVLPWAQEDEALKLLAQKAKEVDVIRQKARDEVVACLKAEQSKLEAEQKRQEEARKLAETQADIADDSFMIKDEDEGNISYNSQGKRIITLKNKSVSVNDVATGDGLSATNQGIIDASKNSDSQGAVYGTKLVLGGNNGAVGYNSKGKVNPRASGSNAAQEELKKSQAEVLRLQAEISELKNRYEAQASRNAKDMDELKGMMSELLSHKKGVNLALEEDEESSSNIIILVLGLGILLLLAALGYLFIRLKRNQMRRALIEADDAENSNCPDLDGDSVNLKESYGSMSKGIKESSEQIKDEDLYPRF